MVRSMVAHRQYGVEKDPKLLHLDMWAAGRENAARTDLGF